MEIKRLFNMTFHVECQISNQCKMLQILFQYSQCYKHYLNLNAESDEIIFVYNCLQNGNLFVYYYANFKDYSYNSCSFSLDFSQTHTSSVSHRHTHVCVCVCVCVCCVCVCVCVFERERERERERKRERG